MSSKLADTDLRSLSSTISGSSTSELQDDDSLEEVALSLTETTKHLLTIQTIAPHDLKACQKLRSALKELSYLSNSIEGESKNEKDIVRILQRCLSEKEETMRHVQHNHEETIRRMSQAHQETVRDMCQRREVANSQMFAAAFSSREK